ncbi:MAG: DUF2065 family protein [Hydrogenophaga sp.]|jgi:hypothetical protein|uniref:DUF2065 domain-containing protein n=1 Tax=unclassified Hydrogenophaga TaxID=2610897 RepID=UPI000A2D312F|nr:DUF2065 family protein [Hydrogenophaga sp. IBVHS1]MDP3253696.1 DUF2065 family protein [Hydrogenophaga sp.]OSZ75177.1 DUF2065 domain-containing protein [Hydrogenophaga sp. IBVHS1]
MSELFWPVLALVLIVEGLLPLLAPGLWRRMFSEMLRLRDGQLRFFGLMSIIGGALLWWLLG